MATPHYGRCALCLRTQCRRPCSRLSSCGAGSCAPRRSRAPAAGPAGRETAGNRQHAWVLPFGHLWPITARRSTTTSRPIQLKGVPKPQGCQPQHLAYLQCCTAPLAPSHLVVVAQLLARRDRALGEDADVVGAVHLAAGSRWWQDSPGDTAGPAARLRLHKCALGALSAMSVRGNSWHADVEAATGAASVLLQQHAMSSLVGSMPPCACLLDDRVAIRVAGVVYEARLVALRQTPPPSLSLLAENTLTAPTKRCTAGTSRKAMGLSCDAGKQRAPRACRRRGR